MPSSLSPLCTAQLIFFQEKWRIIFCPKRLSWYRGCPNNGSFLGTSESARLLDDQNILKSPERVVYFLSILTKCHPLHWFSATGLLGLVKKVLANSSCIRGNRRAEDSCRSRRGTVALALSVQHVTAHAEFYKLPHGHFKPRQKSTLTFDSFRDIYERCWLMAEWWVGVAA